MPILLPLEMPEEPALATDEDRIETSLRQMQEALLAPRLPAVLDATGVRVAFVTAGMKNPRDFNKSLAAIVAAGYAPEKALAALTLAPARMIDLGDRVGSLEAGKDADFVVLDGDPLSVYTRVLETWVEGRRVFDRADPADRLMAVGGFGAGSPRPPQCCMDDGETEGGR